MEDELLANYFLASFHHTKSSLYKYRQQKFPKAPTCRKEIEIPDDWKLTLDRTELFLQIDDGHDERIMVNKI